MSIHQSGVLFCTRDPLKWCLVLYQSIHQSSALFCTKLSIKVVQCFESEHPLKWCHFMCQSIYQSGAMLCIRVSREKIPCFVPTITAYKQNTTRTLGFKEYVYLWTEKLYHHIPQLLYYTCTLCGLEINYQVVILNNQDREHTMRKSVECGVRVVFFTRL